MQGVLERSTVTQLLTHKLSSVDIRQLHGKEPVQFFHLFSACFCMVRIPVHQNGCQVAQYLPSCSGFAEGQGMLRYREETGKPEDMQFQGIQRQSGP